MHVESYFIVSHGKQVRAVRLANLLSRSRLCMCCLGQEKQSPRVKETSNPKWGTLVELVDSEAPDLVSNARVLFF